MYLTGEQLHEATWAAVECLLWSNTLLDVEQDPASEYFVADCEHVHKKRSTAQRCAENLMTKLIEEES